LKIAEQKRFAVNRRHYPYYDGFAEYPQTRVCTTFLLRSYSRSDGRRACVVADIEGMTESH
jgi:hypothetical protein